MLGNVNDNTMIGFELKLKMGDEQWVGRAGLVFQTSLASQRLQVAR
jgi:hypothetical protein